MKRNTPPACPINLLLTTNGNEIAQQVKNLMANWGIDKLIAFVGGSSLGGAELSAVVEQVLGQLAAFPNVAVLTGATKGGLPELATTIAYRLGLKTVAVVPACARPERLLPQVACRLTVQAPTDYSFFGSETPLLISLADGIVALGGGAGTLAELALAFKLNGGRLQAQLTDPTPGAPPLIHIVPIGGFGGVVDALPLLRTTASIDELVWTQSCPPTLLRDGHAAAAYLLCSLGLT